MFAAESDARYARIYTHAFSQQLYEDRIKIINTVHTYWYIYIYNTVAYMHANMPPSLQAASFADRNKYIANCEFRKAHYYGEVD